MTTADNEKEIAVLKVRMRSFEKQCHERHEHVDKAADEIKADLKWVKRQGWAIAVAVLLAVLTFILKS